MQELFDVLLGCIIFEGAIAENDTEGVVLGNSFSEGFVDFLVEATIQ